MLMHKLYWPKVQKAVESARKGQLEGKAADGAEHRAHNDKKKKGSSQRAVNRNITKTLDGYARQRLIVADNFCSSPALALALLTLGFYYVGTQRLDRLEWPSDLTIPQKKGPQYMPRGTYRIAQCRQFPAPVATAWMDSSPVHRIATAYSTTCGTRQWFILHQMVMKRKGKRAPLHAEYMRQLLVELLAVTAVSFRTNRHAEDLASVPTENLDHELRSTDELFKAKSGKSKEKIKSRQHLCQWVCYSGTSAGVNSPTEAKAGGTK
ncbi:uncharacterized protein PITG_16388 [Phytophthora infestans T30-4]|uniref:PiggyBac transposable element-derived protein domain-containing protein n=1 Tax=Phytophthora infestans (strain T30-4) TaxID=403677 RepID=D0NU61_PHYIT|nr:uncharacterized protein PITG_16388 [Phytophthora infestans T30-4]EEY65185.1 conserved hypothetical protein [Phytophthora infestans T30-4]|eukprot:XP_002897442.1 conserved hypothetical protein [Phytophthora infestans T30-4]